MLDFTVFEPLLSSHPAILFLGAGGVSMSSLALDAKARGCRVIGYDAQKSDVTERLENAGIPVYDSFDKEMYNGVKIVVYTAAIHPDDPVFSYAENEGLYLVRRSEYLGYLTRLSKRAIGVAGTHGKSTTTGMLTSIFLAQEGRDPTVMAGAHLTEIDGMWRRGAGDDFLFEACEYQNSFLDFFPRIALVLNVEHDHADFFKTKEDVIRSFVCYMDLARSGCTVVNFDNEGARSAAEKTKTPVYYFSEREKKDLWCENLTEKNGFYSFDAMTPSGLYAHVSLSVPGRHNVSNALGASLVAFLCKIPGEALARGLHQFHGVKRRLEYRGKCGKRPVFDDYAHHPDEIEATLKTVRAMGFTSITVVFQSHTFSRTKAYWDRFISSLSLADEVILADIYPAREKPIPGIDAPHLAEAIPKAQYLGDFDQIAKYLLSQTDKEGALIVMGAGNIVSLTDQILTEKEKA